MEKDYYRKLYEYYNIFNKDKTFLDIFYGVNAPIPYKDLFIYPVQTLYYAIFHSFATCFFANKYDSGIRECMGMNSLQFLFYQNFKDGIDNAQMYLPLLEQLLLMCLHKEPFANGKKTIDFIQRDKNKCFILIEGKQYDWKDFEAIRDIICEQNCIELPNYKIHPDIRKKLKEKEDLLNRINKKKVASFEELIDCLMLAGHYSEDYILNLSIRRFTNLLKRYDIMKTYELMTILSPNMKQRDIENIPSWISAMPKQDQYFSKIQNISEIQNQIGDMNK